MSNTQNRKRRNACILLLIGLFMLGVGIYFLVRDFQAQAADWYYWFGLILAGDLFLILGVRMLKRAEET